MDQLAAIEHWRTACTSRLFDIIMERFGRPGVDIYAIEEASDYSSVFELDEALASAVGFVSLTRGTRGRMFCNLRLWPKKPHRERGWVDAPLPLFTLSELAQEPYRKGPEINLGYFTRVALGDRRETELMQFAFVMLGLAIELTAALRPTHT